MKYLDFTDVRPACGTSGSNRAGRLYLLFPLHRCCKFCRDIIAHHARRNDEQTLLAIKRARRLVKLNFHAWDTAFLYGQMPPRSLDLSGVDLTGGLNETGACSTHSTIQCKFSC